MEVLKSLCTSDLFIIEFQGQLCNFNVLKNKTTKIP